MRAVLVRALEVTVVPTVGLALALLLLPGAAALEVHVWLLVVLAGALLALVAAIRGSTPTPPSLFDAAFVRPQSRTPEFGDLARLGREVSMATGSAYDLHFRLRPTVRELAAGLLRFHRGVELDRQPERAQALLGDETWELVRADRPIPGERRGPGITQAALDRMVTALERL
jgi:hypothetical protein